MTCTKRGSQIKHKHLWDRPEPYCNHVTEQKIDGATRFIDEWFYPVCKICGKLKY